MALSACSGSKGGVMAGRSAPDEFLVSKRAPLTILPDFSLTLPKPCAPRPQEADLSQQALSAMFGGPAKRSTTETDIISMTKVIAEPGIRSRRRRHQDRDGRQRLGDAHDPAAEASNNADVTVTTGN